MAYFVALPCAGEGELRTRARVEERGRGGTQLKTIFPGECPGSGAFEWEWRGPGEEEVRHPDRSRSLVVLGMTRPFGGTHYHRH